MSIVDNVNDRVNVTGAKDRDLRTERASRLLDPCEVFLPSCPSVSTIPPLRSLSEAPAENGQCLDDVDVSKIELGA